MSPETESPRHVSGFVSILGRPNAGKSTLLNALVGVKIAIVADKPQTTRTNIQGVLTGPGVQVVFLDTPGIHKADSPLNKRMMDRVREALDGRDLLLYLVDSTRPFTVEDEHAASVIPKSKTPALCVLNKIDRMKDKGRLLPLIDEYRGRFPFEEYLPISARTGDGLDTLRKAIAGRLPEGPPYFPEDYLTDQPERFLAAELIREQALQETHQEVPHAVAVLIEQWKEEKRLTRIAATILVEKEGQKAILIGQKGQRLKAVGTAARLEMEALFNRKIFLELYVKVRPGWREKAEFLDQLDWRSMAGIELES